MARCKMARCKMAEYRIYPTLVKFIFKEDQSVDIDGRLL